MAPDKLRIEFDNESGSYWPGQTVEGKVIVSLESDKEATGLRVNLKGRVFVNWEASERSVKGSKKTVAVTSVLEDSESLFEHEFYALSDGKSTVVIPAGENEYPFSYILPEGLPASFEGSYGKVSYEVEAELEGPLKFETEVKREFTMNAVHDLNTDSLVGMTVQRSTSRSFCCFCCTSGPVGYALKISRLAYVPGEYVKFEVEIRNHSNKVVTGATFSVVQTAVVYAKDKSRSKEETKTMLSVKHGRVEPGDTDIWRGNVLQIPSLPPTGLGNCRLIDVKYKLHFKMEVAGSGSNFSETLPLSIGSIPLRHTFATFVRLPSDSDVDFSALPFSLYQNLPAPFYVDVIRPEASPVDETEEFVPKYVTYKLLT